MNNKLVANKIILDMYRDIYDYFINEFEKDLREKIKNTIENPDRGIVGNYIYYQYSKIISLGNSVILSTKLPTPNKLRCEDLWLIANEIKSGYFEVVCFVKINELYLKEYAEKFISFCELECNIDKSQLNHSELYKKTFYYNRKFV
jgi:hypothetical protein